MASLRKSEMVGLAVALAGHVALVWVLAMEHSTPPRPPQRMTVTISDDVGLQSTSPSQEQAAPDQAPQLGEAQPEEQAAPQKPEPVAKPEPVPVPRPQPVPKPEPVKPQPRPEPPKPKPQPVVHKPEPAKPEPRKPEPKPAPHKPEPRKPEKVQDDPSAVPLPRERARRRPRQPARAPRMRNPATSPPVAAVWARTS
jgi:hypothetical protein